MAALTLSACGSDDNTASGSEQAGSSATAADVECAPGTLDGEGSSAQKNAIDEAIASYQEACPEATVNYNPTGSGAGIKQFIAGQVAFAGSDSALRTTPKDGAVEVEQAAERCSANPALDLPLVAGPIAVAYNLPGVDGVVVTPEVLSKIFLGQITSWNDAALAAINPGVTLPDTAIKVFFRSDESGTTENFAKYLSNAAATTWTAEPSKSWPGTAGEGREKSAGVSEGVKTTDGGITYVEWSYAKDNGLQVAKVDNGGGPVELTGESAGKALAVAKREGTGNDLRLSLDYATTAEGVYPIVLVTYQIVCSKGLPAQETALLKAFLTHLSSAEVQAGLEDLGYAPLPEEVRSDVAAAVQSIS